MAKTFIAVVMAKVMLASSSRGWLRFGARLPNTQKTWVEFNTLPLKITSFFCDKLSPIAWAYILVADLE
jgi:hypothetical protein